MAKTVKIEQNWKESKLSKRSKYIKKDITVKAIKNIETDCRKVGRAEILSTINYLRVAIKKESRKEVNKNKNNRRN